MLIVIVIIGILAAALIPRLASARGRANDTARKADLRQAGSAIVSYQIDRGIYPTVPATVALSDISGALLAAGINSVPRDPNPANAFTGL